MEVLVGNSTELAEVRSVMAGAVSADVVGLANFMISDSLDSFLPHLLQLNTDLKLQIHCKSYESYQKSIILQILTDQMLLLRRSYDL